MNKPEAAEFAKMGKHLSTANELQTNVQICCVLHATTITVSSDANQIANLI